MEDEGEGGVKGNALVFGLKLRQGKEHEGRRLAAQVSPLQLCFLGSGEDWLSLAGP